MSGALAAGSTRTPSSSISTTTAPYRHCPQRPSPTRALSGERLRILGVGLQRLAQHRGSQPFPEVRQFGERGVGLSAGLRVALLDERQDDLFIEARLPLG